MRRRTLGGPGQCGQRLPEITVERHLARAVPAAVVEIDVNQPGVLVEHRRAAEGQPEVERDSDHQHEVGFAQRHASGAGGVVGAVGRDDASRQPITDRRQIGHTQQLTELRLGVRPPDPGTGHHRRPARRPQQRGSGCDGVGIGMRARVGDQVLGLLRKLGGAEEDVRGDVQEGGPRARAERRADGLTDGAVDLFRRLVCANLVRLRTTGRWSSSCSEPIPAVASGERPPITSIGLSLARAPARVEIVLVTPGPAVTAATPHCRVSFDQPSAAKAAVCSLRTSTRLMPYSTAPIRTPQMWPPLRVKR